MKTLADRLKDERDALGWSQPELARRSGVKQSFIGALEAGNQKSSSWLPELAHALKVDAYWLKTGRGQRTGGVSLSSDEQTIIDAFRLFDEGRKDEWLYVANKQLNERGRKNAA